MASVAKEWREIPGRYNMDGSKCPCCGKVYFPKRNMCPKCRRESVGKMEEYTLSKDGTVYSYSIVYDAPEFASKLKPYAVVMVKTTDGVLISGQLVDVDISTVKIGMKVTAVLRKLSADGPDGIIKYGYKFVPM